MGASKPSDGGNGKAGEWGLWKGGAQPVTVHQSPITAFSYSASLRPCVSAFHMEFAFSAKSGGLARFTRCPTVRSQITPESSRTGP